MDYRERLRRMVQLRLDRRVAAGSIPPTFLQDAYLDASQQFDHYVAEPPMPLFCGCGFSPASG